MISLEEIESLYQKEYFEKDYHCGMSERSYIEEAENNQKEFRPFLHMIRKFCSSGRYLEVGCAGGATLAEARSHGFSVVGVELSPEMALWGRNNFAMDIRVGTLEQQKFPENSFDVVYLGDVIEHIQEPENLLYELLRILKPSGIAAFAYPMDLNHIRPRIRIALKLQRQSPHKPYHLYYYTTDTLRMLLEQCEFEVLFEKTDKTIQREPVIARGLDSVNYLLTKLTGTWGDRGFTISRSQKE